MQETTILTLFMALWLGAQAYAHGEQKPGPHGGHIRMPGGFHTEVMPAENGAFKVYLLDVSFENPVTEQSILAVRLTRNGKSMDIACLPGKDFFTCPVPKGENLDSGILAVKASRKGSTGVVVEYKLPLKFSDTAH